MVGISGYIDGYASDLTRVFYLGHVPEEERERAQTAGGCAAAEAAMKPGVQVSEINRICEGYIRDSRFGRFLLHSSGHGIGLYVVEYPTIHDEAREEQPGIVFAVENGVYDGAAWITGPGEPVIERKPMQRPGEICFPGLLCM